MIYLALSILFGIALGVAIPSHSTRDRDRRNRADRERHEEAREAELFVELLRRERARRGANTPERNKVVKLEDRRQA